MTHFSLPLLFSLVNMSYLFFPLFFSMYFQTFQVFFIFIRFLFLCFILISKSLPQIFPFWNSCCFHCFILCLFFMFASCFCCLLQDQDCNKTVFLENPFSKLVKVCTFCSMQPRCAMRFESHTPKSLAMRKSFFASDAKTHSLDLKSQENARKKACENPAMLACDAKNRGVF